MNMMVMSRISQEMMTMDGIDFLEEIQEYIDQFPDHYNLILTKQEIQKLINLSKGLK